MRLREHPLLSYRGYSMWPPIWVGIGGTTGHHPQGEVGRLKEVRYYETRPCRLFLAMDYGGALYTGCLLFDDNESCQRVVEVLRCCYDMFIRDIGGLDLPTTPFNLPRTYRKILDSKTWHFCSNCSHWPHENYKRQMLPPGSDELCNECKTLQQQLSCH